MADQRCRRQGRQEGFLIAVEPGARENRGEGRTWQGEPPTKTVSVRPGVACEAGCVQLWAGWALWVAKSRVPFPLPQAGLVAFCRGLWRPGGRGICQGLKSQQDSPLLRSPLCYPRPRLTLPPSWVGVSQAVSSCCQLVWTAGLTFQSLPGLIVMPLGFGPRVWAKVRAPGLP